MASTTSPSYGSCATPRAAEGEAAAADLSDACENGCCNDVSDDDVSTESEAGTTAGAAADDCSCCSTPSSPQPTAAASAPLQLCRSAESPSCCQDHVEAAAPTVTPCRAATAPRCCSPQLTPSPASAASVTAVTSCKHFTSTSTSTSQRRWRSAALLISLATVVWNVVEGSLSVVFGAEDLSVALLGFGADSWVEVFSAVVVAHRFWREESHRADSREKERRATLIIGSLLLILAVCIAGGSCSALILRERPDSSVSGIAISSAAIAVMAVLYLLKVRIALALSSSAMESDAQCSLCCIQLSLVLFVGSLVSHYAGGSVWWFDGVTALVIALMVGREGFNAVRNAQRPDFSGCNCCDDNSGWYITWLRKRLQTSTSTAASTRPPRPGAGLVSLSSPREFELSHHGDHSPR